MKKNSTQHPFLSVYADSEHFYLEAPTGHDVARVERITETGWPDLEPGNYLSDEQWQVLINLVSSAPQLLDACRSLLRDAVPVAAEVEGEEVVVRLTPSEWEEICRATESARHAISRATNQ